MSCSLVVEARWSRGQTPGGLVTSGGLDSRCQGAGTHGSVRGGRRVTWRSGVCPDMSPGIAIGLEISKRLRSQAR